MSQVQNGKDMVRNLQCSPQNQLVRGLYIMSIMLFISDCFNEMCEIWNTSEESFQQVGYSLELKPVWEGNNFWVVYRELKHVIFFKHKQQMKVSCFSI